MSNITEALGMIETKGLVASVEAADAMVKATLVGDIRGEKIRVFKKKRRKGYRKTQGHRQRYSVITIDKIIG